MKIERGLAFPDADQFMVNELKVDGTYQIEHLRMALTHVKNWDCAIDGGAHIGTWSMVMSDHFVRVIAVEPSEDTREALIWNLAKSQCANVDVKAVALGDRAGVVDMHLDREQQQKANTGARFVKPGGAIPVEKIDNWELPSLGFLKLDVEGSEYVALRGAKETIKRCKPVILFENKWLWTKHYGLPKDIVANFLMNQNYQLLGQVSRDQIWGPR